MPGLEPGIQGQQARSKRPWIAGSSPAMTREGEAVRYQSLNALAPYLVLPVLMAAALPFMDAATWATLGIAGIAMGMMLFLMASGLTVIFGLMDVLNFAHGAFITVGAYLAVTVLPRLSGLAGPDSWPLNLAALLIAVALGLVVYIAMHLVLNRTRVGLLVRAGVENREMVEALGYRIRRLFLGVFMTGSALAGLGGVMWALYREQVHASMSDDLTVLIFIVVIIGGLGSIGGCFIGALLVAMVANYGGFLVPKLALVSNILLMVAILMWRPRGLYAVTNR
jgi:branched-subunit amino acid ABC-type transport system permease component